MCLFQTAVYRNYMKSDAWEQKKQERMRIDEYKCVMCGRSIDQCKSLQVHHVTYKRLGDENVLDDLCTVCGSCHQKIHNYYNRKRGERA